MNTQPGLVLCKRLRDPQYGAYPRLAADLADVLVGWTLAAPQDGDGGVPAAVRDVLVQACISRHRIAYLVDPSGTAVDARTPAPGLTGRLRKPLGWRFAEQSADAQGLFDQMSHPWALGGQCVLLYGDLPSFESAALWSIAQRQVLVDAPLLAGEHLLGAMFPGVDGDFVHALFATGEACDAWCEALSAAAVARGLGVREVDATTFRRMAWIDGN